MSNSPLHRSPPAPISQADWLLTPAGRYLAGWALGVADNLLLDVFGLHAAQIGCESLDLLGKNRIQHRFRCIANDGFAMVPHAGQTPLSVQIDPAALPFATDSLDLVVLPFVLEFHETPHQVLREAQRVLRPEGKLLILGFNPISFWGLRNAVSRLFSVSSPRPGKTAFPWPGNYLALLRLKDWLKLLDFEVSRGRFGCYAPPCHRERSLQNLRWLDLAGDRWWGFAGGCYALMAVKRISGLTLITPAWATPEQKLRRKARLVTERQIEHPIEQHRTTSSEAALKSTPFQATKA